MGKGQGRIMAPPTITFTLTGKAIPVEPDGSLCMWCNDMVLLRAFRLEVWHGKQKVAQSPGLICGGCRDTLDVPDES
jgi:hypothetical protein